MAQVSEDLFIEPGLNLTEQSPELATVINLSPHALRTRWESQHGKYIINRWTARSFARPILDEMVGRYYGHTDLRGIPLSAIKFWDVDLSNIDFFAANFEGSEFNRVDLTDSWLSHSNLRHAAFKWSKMGGVLIDGVDYDTQTSFVGIDLRAVNFTLAALLEENALAELRITHLKRHSPVLARFLGATCDYGRSFPRFFYSCLAIVLAFGALFYLLPHSTGARSVGASMFFSLANFLRLSSANLSESSALVQVPAVIELIIGYIMLGVLVSIIIRRTIGR